MNATFDNYLSSEYLSPEYNLQEAPMNHSIWLAVDSNGNEKMSSCKLGFQRFSPRLYHCRYAPDSKTRNLAYKERQKVCSYNDTQMKDDHWVEVFSGDELGKTGAYPRWSYLPKGSIKKLIGRELTWEDEPVKYEG